MPDNRKPRSIQYPIRCIECRAKAVRPAVVPYTAEVNHDGRIYSLEIPDLHVNRCTKCGELYFDIDSDDRISAALREKLRLLTPEQIKSGVQALGLTQKEVAERLGIAPETLSRWISGSVIQSRAMDNLLRVFFAVPEVRRVLAASSAQLISRPKESEAQAAARARRSLNI